MGVETHTALRPCEEGGKFLEEPRAKRSPFEGDLLQEVLGGLTQMSGGFKDKRDHVCPIRARISGDLRSLLTRGRGTLSRGGCDVC